jgi:hypothetical protein
MAKTRLYRKMERYHRHNSVNKHSRLNLDLEDRWVDNPDHDPQKASRDKTEILSFVRKRYNEFNDQIAEKLSEFGISFSAPEFEPYLLALPAGAGISMRYGTTQQHYQGDSRGYKESLEKIVPELSKFARKAGIWMLEVNGPGYSGLEIITDRARAKR